MKRLRILHVGYIDDRRFSGVATVVPNYLKYQARHADVALLNISSYIPDHSVGAYKTFTYGRLPLDDIIASFGALDLVVFHEVYRPEFVRVAEKLRSVGVPYIITPHVSLTNTAQNHKWLKKRIGNALVFGKFIKGASAIHFLSESEKQQSGHFNQQVSFVCNNGIELKGRLKRQFTKDGLRLIYVGRFEIKIKGIDRILDAVNSIQNKMREKNIRVSLYGYDEANNVQWIDNTIKKLGIGDLVTVGGPLFDRQKVDKILQHDCFIQLSRTEGQPLAIMEAMDVGMPCIVTDGTTFADIVRDNNTGIAAGDAPEEIGQAVLEFARQQGEFQGMSKRASSYANQLFSWDIMGKQMIDKYRAVLGVAEADT